ncbi:hypothetical protein BD779DRAFT_298687 [Infundibulicybe gibba]|nr:hypothetical protein BD779DRAFT_298687 [Infundibulicybe gibba]
MYGPAGTGKSAIAQTVAELCHKSQSLGASYFFTKGSTGASPPLFSTLAHQLMLVVPGLDDHIWATICEDGTVFKKSMGEQLDRLIVQPFQKLITKPSRVTIIIDGLDECENAVIQTDIIQLILSIGIHSPPLQFLITSRPEPKIRRVFESYVNIPLVHLPLDGSLNPDRDIRHFLCHEFERIYQQSVELGMPTASQLPWPSAEAINELVVKSSGHFIYAATVINFVQEEHAHPMEQLNAILQITSESTTPSTEAQGIFAQSIAFQDLDGLYLHILRKYRNKMGLARILRAIMHFGDNALAGYLETIFRLTPGTVRIMLGGLHSIIDVRDTGALQFSHASFNDFLADPERSREFHYDTSRFEAELACACMRLVLS